MKIKSICRKCGNLKIKDEETGRIIRSRACYPGHLSDWKVIK